MVAIFSATSLKRHLILKSSSPPIGAIAFGKSSVGCRVIEAGPSGLTLLYPDGKQFRASVNSIVRWENPPNTTPQSGDRVQLRGTTLEYTVAEIYPVNQGTVIEQWARLGAGEGVTAKWKVSQLEVVQFEVVQ
jgi:hypothetical protein